MQSTHKSKIQQIQRQSPLLNSFKRKFHAAKSEKFSFGKFKLEPHFYITKPHDHTDLLTDTESNRTGTLNTLELWLCKI